MPPEPRLEQHAAFQQSGYPRVDDSTLRAVNEHIEKIVLLMHGGTLSELQLEEMRLSLAIQTKVSERLHQFNLRNGDEPAFVFHAV